MATRLEKRVAFLSAQILRNSLKKPVLTQGRIVFPWLSTGFSQTVWIAACTHILCLKPLVSTTYKHSALIQQLSRGKAEALPI
jgi:hypothetical protein